MQENNPDDQYFVIQSITVYLELNDVNPTSTFDQSEDQSENRLVIHFIEITSLQATHIFPNRSLDSTNSSSEAFRNKYVSIFLSR